MKRLLLLCAILATSQNAALGATELLTNPGLDVLDSDGNPNPAVYYDMPVGWLIETDPCSYSPCSIVRYPGFPATYADRLQAGGNGVVFNSTEGDFPGFPDVIFVDADLTQTVPATPGLQYKMTGHAYFEGGYAGGVDTIATGTGTTREGLPSMTDTFFALEFLDAGNNVLGGSVDIELRAAGQVNNPDQTEQTRNWMKHTLIGVAPAGTVNVRVRASMVDGEYNIDLPHQAAWVDDFSLSVVPEPTSSLLAVLGLAVAGSVRRKR
jgi:hypothetical protein